MKYEVRVREVFKLIHCKNKLSGHQWTEHGPTTGYVVVGPYGEIVGPYGEISRHRTEARALAEQAAWQAFFDNLEQPSEIRQGAMK